MAIDTKVNYLIGGTGVNLDPAFNNPTLNDLGSDKKITDGFTTDIAASLVDDANAVTANTNMITQATAYTTATFIPIDAGLATTSTILLNVQIIKMVRKVRANFALATDEYTIQCTCQWVVSP